MQSYSELEENKEISEQQQSLSWDHFLDDKTKL